MLNWYLGDRNVPRKTSLHHHSTSLNFDARQGESTPSCCFQQIPSMCYSRNWDSLDKAKFFQSSVVQFRWACADCTVGRNMYFKIWCVVHSEMHLLHTLVVMNYSCPLSAVWPFPSDLWHQQENCGSLDIFSLSDRSLQIQELVTQENSSRSAVCKIFRLPGTNNQRHMNHLSSLF